MCVYIIVTFRFSTCNFVSADFNVKVAGYFDLPMYECCSKSSTTSDTKLFLKAVVVDITSFTEDTNIWKDISGFNIIIIILTIIFIISPYFLSDPENFILGNLLVTPIHIQPEYFLFAYAILRSISNKLGVIALIISILIFIISPLTKIIY